MGVLVTVTEHFVHRKIIPRSAFSAFVMTALSGQCNYSMEPCPVAASRFI
jgi:hypothetical protein